MIYRLEEKQLSKLFDLLKKSKSRPEGLNKSYMLEATNISMLRIYYSPAFESVFYGFALKTGWCFETWKEGKDLINTAKTLAKKFKGEIIIGFDSQKTGKKIGWQELKGKALEMKLPAKQFADAEIDFTPKMKEKAIKLLSQEWWTKKQASGFIDACLQNKQAFSKMIFERNKAIAFGHAAFDGKKAWINAIYVDKESRGKGLGERMNKSLIGKLYSLGVKQVFLGVDEGNNAAITLYKKLGFKFTRFKKHQFMVAA